MTSDVHWMLELNIKEGELQNIKTLMNEMVEATQENEPDTKNYEWFISDDGKSCHIYERYTDSAATMKHLGTFGERFAERFFAALEPTKFVIYGAPNEEVRQALAEASPLYMEQIGGFAR